MKKSIICIACVLCVIFASFIVYIVDINERHEADLAALYSMHNEEITELLNENADLSRTVCYLEQQIYNIVEDNNYNVTIHHNGELHTYIYENNGIFGDFTHLVSTY